MKKLLLVAVVVALAVAAQSRLGHAPSHVSDHQADAAATSTAPVAVQLQPGQVTGAGRVIKLLSDDTNGSRHQRFLLRLASGQTVLIAHNIDLAPRVAPLRVGDSIEYSGEYVANARGGVVHWTHRDPDGRHTGGWLRHDGATFQ